MQGFTSPYFTSKTVEKLLANTMTTSKPKEQNYTSLASIKSSSTSSRRALRFFSSLQPREPA